MAGGGFGVPRSVFSGLLVCLSAVKSGFVINLHPVCVFVMSLFKLVVHVSLVCCFDRETSGDL